MTEKSYINYVINACYGGFGVSKRAEVMYLQKKYPDATVYAWYSDDTFVPITVGELPDESTSRFPLDVPYIYASKAKHLSSYDELLAEDDKDEFSINWNDPELRKDPILVDVVKELGAQACTACSQPKVVEVPADADVYIEYDDGLETIHEKHRIWR